MSPVVVQFGCSGCCAASVFVVVVVVAERQLVAFEVHGPDLAGRQQLPVRAADAHDADRRAAHRAAVRDPVLRADQRRARCPRWRRSTRG